MKILGWNCHGICNAATVRTLKAHIKGNSLYIVFLSETKAFVNRTKEVLRLIYRQAKGAIGGICVMWK